MTDLILSLILVFAATAPTTTPTSVDVETPSAVTSETEVTTDTKSERQSETAAFAASAASEVAKRAATALKDPIAPLELTVTATRLPQDPFALPPMVSVVGPERIAQLQLNQAPNLLRGVPGILIQKSNLGGGSPFIHGLTGKQVLLLVDGVRMNNSLYRFGPHQYLNTIDPYTIQRVEVVRGPASVLYGSDALGGVINVVTRSPRQVEGIGAGASIGGATADESVRGRFQIEGRADATGALAGLTAHRFNDLRAGAPVGVQKATGYDALAADLKLTHHLTDELSLIGATQIVRQYDVPKSNEVLLGGKLKYDYEPQLRWLSYVQVHGDDMKGAVDDMVLSFSYQDHQEGEKIINAAGAPERNERNDARTFGAFLHLSKDLGFGNTLGFGGEWYADRINSEAFEQTTTSTRVVKPAFPDGAVYQSYGLYAQNEWRPVTTLGVLVGGRYSRFEAEGSLDDPAGEPIELDLEADDFTASAGLVWEFVDGIFAAGQAAQGFRAPNMEDFFGKVDFAREIPNTDLRPEKSNDYEAGLKLRKWGFRAEAFVFRSYYRDLIDRVTVNFDIDGDSTLEQVAQRRNVNRAIIEGFESGLSYRLDDVEVFGSFAATFGDELDDVDGALERAEPLRRIPPKQGIGGLRYHLEPRSFVGAEVEWAWRQLRLSGGDIGDPRIGPEGTPGYAVLNLRSGVAVSEESRLRAGIENVFDQQYKAHGSGIWFAGRSVYLEYSVGL